MKAIVPSVFCLLAVLFGTASAAVFYVHPESTQNCIQECLDACCNCDTVLVGPGTYHENIVWPDTNGIKLLGEFGRDTTFIDGGDSGRVILMGAGADSTTVVRGFTVRNGYADSVGGAGVRCAPGSSPLIEECSFLDNWCGVTSRLVCGGGGIGCDRATPVIRSNHFEGNHSCFGGGGIGTWVCNPEIIGNTIVRNTSDTLGGGILCHQSSSPVIRGNTIEYDSAGYGGGIMMSIYCNPTVDSNVVRHNRADWGGGLYAYWLSHPTVTRCVIDSNVASGGAPGMFIRDRCHPRISHCFIRDNIGIGAVYCELPGTNPTLEFCTISGNSYVGVGVEADCRATVRWSSLPHNGGDAIVALGDADARFNWWGHESGPFRPGVNPGGQGDTVSNNVDFGPWLGSEVIHYVHPDSADNTIQAALDACAANEAACIGPGTYVENLTWPNTQGIRLASQALNPDSAVIDGDSAGSVIHCATPVDTSTWIYGLTIRNGYSVPGTMGGGGLYCYASSPSVARNRFTGNQTPGGDNGGGGILARAGSHPHIVENEFTNNTAGWGGAICCYVNSSPLILRNAISGNRAVTSSGGIEVMAASAPVIRGNNIRGNRGPWGGGLDIGDRSCPVVDSNFFRYDTADIGGAIACWSIDSAFITRNVIEYCVADSFGGGIFTEMNSTPTIRHCTITNCFAVTDRDGGIGCATNSAPDIDSCDIYSNTPHGIVARTGALPTVNACNISGNAGYGLLHVTSGPDTIDATHNWWGHASGPYHQSLNPTGQGDTVSDYVLFEPWDTLPIIGVAEPGEPLRPVRRLATTFVRSVLDLTPGDDAALLDISGRKVADLAPGPNDIRHLAPGIYFIHRPTADSRQLTAVRKVIVTR